MWARAKHVAEGSEVVHLEEPLHERINRLELWMREVQLDATKDWTRINVERLYVDKNFTTIEQTLTCLTRCMTICEKFTKNCNRMHGELSTLNEDMAAICSSQSVLQGLPYYLLNMPKT